MYVDYAEFFRCIVAKSTKKGKCYSFQSNNQPIKTGYNKKAFTTFFVCCVLRQFFLLVTWSYVVKNFSFSRCKTPWKKILTIGKSLAQACQIHQFQHFWTKSYQTIKCTMWNFCLNLLTFPRWIQATIWSFHPNYSLPNVIQVSLPRKFPIVVMWLQFSTEE